VKPDGRESLPLREIVLDVTRLRARGTVETKGDRTVELGALLSAATELWPVAATPAKVPAESAEFPQEIVHCCSHPMNRTASFCPDGSRRQKLTGYRR